jgi:hypothetical protein
VSAEIKKAIAILKEKRETFEKHYETTQQVRAMLKNHPSVTRPDVQSDLVDAVYILLSLTEMQWEAMVESKDTLDKIAAILKEQGA